jgi:hypothetical protein
MVVTGALAVNATITTSGALMSMAGSFTACATTGTFTATKVETHIAVLNGAQVVPASNGTGLGFAVLSKIDETSLKLRVYWTGVTATYLHLHFGNGCGTAQTAGVIDLEYADEPSPYETEIINMSATDWTQLRGGLWSFDIPSATHPLGQIRGQFSRDDTVKCPAN